MLHRTEGIVLRSVEYGEADLIVTHLTASFGIVKTFAKSPRKTKSRFGSSLEPLTHAAIAFWGKEDAGLPRLTQSDIINPFDGLRGSLRGFLRVTEIIEMTLAMIPERMPGITVFSLLLRTLKLLEQDCESPLTVLSYKIKLLEAAGFLPGMRKCGRCGRDGVEFHFSQGTVLCGECSDGAGHSQTISQGSVNLFRNLLAWEPEKLGRIKPLSAQVEELTTVLGEHIRFVTETHPRAREFYAS